MTHVFIAHIFIQESQLELRQILGRSSLCFSPGASGWLPSKGPQGKADGAHAFSPPPPQHTPDGQEQAPTPTQQKSGLKGFSQSGCSVGWIDRGSPGLTASWGCADQLAVVEELLICEKRLLGTLSPFRTRPLQHPCPGGLWGIRLGLKHCPLFRKVKRVTKAWPQGNMNKCTHQVLVCFLFSSHFPLSLSLEPSWADRVWLSRQFGGLWPLSIHLPTWPNLNPQLESALQTSSWETVQKFLVPQPPPRCWHLSREVFEHVAGAQNL